MILLSGYQWIRRVPINPKGEILPGGTSWQTGSGTNGSIDSRYVASFRDSSSRILLRGAFFFGTFGRTSKSWVHLILLAENASYISDAKSNLCRSFLNRFSAVINHFTFFVHTAKDLQFLSHSFEINLAYFDLLRNTISRESERSSIQTSIHPFVQLSKRRSPHQGPFSRVRSPLSDQPLFQNKMRLSSYSS